jgi:osmotically-inducible protein OsmY
MHLRFKHSGGFCGVASVIILLMITASVNAMTPLEDPAVNDAVENAIIQDMAVPYDDIDIKTMNGIVTLSGDVNHLLAKNRAVRIAQTVKGVRAVIDKIRVTPSRPLSDAEIEKNIEAALQFNDANETYEVNIVVKNGEVRLSGTVDSGQEKMAVEKEAMGVRGVRQLDNQIKVKIKKDRSDPAIMADVEAALRWDVFVDHRAIDVRVKDGEVILSGTVGSAAEKNEAMLNAWVAGVKSVDISNLDVSWLARKEQLRRQAYVYNSDVDIRRAVKDALLLDPYVSSFNVVPHVRAGLVTLRGEVENAKAKRAAAQDARNTVGVLDVRNRIKVRPQSQISDRQIEDNVRAALARDPGLHEFDITVKVYDNTVYLSGDVVTFYQKVRADDIAAGIRGVKTVKNNLTVHYDHLPYILKPFIDAGDISDYDWYDYRPSGALKPDAVTKADIQDELFWSPFVDSDQIAVSVEDGIATLDGRVETRAQKRMAEINAFEGGAIRVTNNLKVGR